MRFSAEVRTEFYAILATFSIMNWSVTYKEDLVFEEEMKVESAWNGENSMYNIYPPVQVEKNPNLVRK
ncbi:protein containing RagB/SusD domain protein [Bacteroides sp. CAG:530]|nr:protein containing RagB/SusD domain protein [Bacteroides sp. CAG:530]